MKNLLYAIIILIIWSAIVWFARGWWDKKSIPESDLEVKIDTVYQTITHHFIDTVTIRESIYIPREMIKEVTRYDTVYLEKEQVQSKFHFNPEPFDIEALCYADCMVDSIGFSYYPDKKYFEELGLRFYQDGYRAGIDGYPTWKKFCYYSAGLVSAAAFYMTTQSINK